MTTFAQITTMAVGGNINRFIEPTTRVAIIEEVEHADSKGIPLCVIGGGSNIVASDEDFQGVVIRDARRIITVPDEAAPVENGDKTVHVNAQAGCNWDDLVQFTVERGLAGLEALSGIPGTVGASVVQNIGAYGQEVASSVESVEVWDREEKQTKELSHEDMAFSYRTSLLKQSMMGANNQYYPTPRYIVLSVTFSLLHEPNGVVQYDQLAHALHASVGDTMPLHEIRNAVMKVRASKGMLEDATRYRIPQMQATKDSKHVEEAIAMQHRTVSHEDTPQERDILDIESATGSNEDYDRHSCGSFFINPFLTQEQANNLPQDAPRYEATLPDGTTTIKTSAAWLIDHAGFNKGYTLENHPHASISHLHTLAMTNQGGASAQDIMALATAVRDGVRQKFGITLEPEPVLINIGFIK